ncbi:MAG: hypothetical protein GY756_04100 [bacterium]|nr:hypothetical protein [bacterium]
MKPVISVGRYMLFYIGIIGILSFFIFSNWRFLFMPFLSIVVSFWLWIRISTPPVIIILSSSHPNCLKRHRMYKRLVSPLRVVTLLDFTSVYAQKIQTELHLDCLRATNDNDWWDEIAILFTLTPFIIIDTLLL